MATLSKRARYPNVPMRAEIEFIIGERNKKRVVKAKYRFADLVAAINQAERSTLEDVTKDFESRGKSRWPTRTGESLGAFKTGLGEKHGDDEANYVRSATFFVWRNSTHYARALERGSFYVTTRGTTVRRKAGKYLRRAWQSVWRTWKKKMASEVVDRVDAILQKESRKRLR